MACGVEGAQNRVPLRFWRLRQEVSGAVKRLEQAMQQIIETTLLAAAVRDPTPVADSGGVRCCVKRIGAHPRASDWDRSHRSASFHNSQKPFDALLSVSMTCP
jgi:hypothetical protein